jgi:alpha/beta superfamily hydrolase
MDRLEIIFSGFALVILFLVFYVAFVSAGQSSEDLEETVCGWFKERLAFATWSRAAGAPNPDVWHSVPGAAPVSHRTRDGRVLRGYKIAARTAQGASAPRKGFVLVAQGNAMLADHLLHELRAFGDDGRDLFVYDYRGYGNSQGKRRFKAMVSDYRELLDSLSADPKDEKLLYGISFGGIVLLNVIGGGAEFHRAVIDSSPGQISQFGCPEKYDPVRHLPTDSSRLMIISGKKDTVVRPADMSELIATAKIRGAQVVVSDDFAHPFMDRQPSVHQQRQKLIREFLFK